MRQDVRGAMSLKEGADSASGAADGLWLVVFRRYVVASTVGHLAWEILQLPLYTIWREGSAGEIGFAVVHCTGGDLLIAIVSLLGAAMIFGDRRWPRSRFLAVGAAAVLSSVAYTVYSEWLNTEVRGGWAYGQLMPTLPLIGTGISPLAQWIIVPCAAMWWARRAPGSSRRDGGVT